MRVRDAAEAEAGYCWVGGHVREAEPPGQDVPRLCLEGGPSSLKQRQRARGYSRVVVGAWGRCREPSGTLVRLGSPDLLHSLQGTAKGAPPPQESCRSGPVPVAENPPPIDSPTH